MELDFLSCRFSTRVWSESSFLADKKSSTIEGPDSKSSDIAVEELSDGMESGAAQKGTTLILE